MAAGRIIVSGWMPALDSDGEPIPNARMYFYQNQTTSLAVVYTDATLTTPLPNPVAANSSGQFPAIWADDANLFSVTIDAPFGPPGQPFTYDSLGPSTSANTDATNKLDRDGLNPTPDIMDNLPFKPIGITAPNVLRSAGAKLDDVLDVTEGLNAIEREAVDAEAYDGPDMSANIQDYIEQQGNRYRGLAVPFYMRRGVWTLRNQVEFTPYGINDRSETNGIIVRGYGNKGTRIVVPPGCPGGFKVTQPLAQIPKQYFEFRDLQFISTVDIRTDGALDSGYAIDVIGGNVLDDPFGLGLNSDISLRIVDCHFIPDYAPDGGDHVYLGRWKAPIRAKGIYFPEIKGCYFRGAFDDAIGPNGPQGPAIDMTDCYAPRVESCSVNGPFYALLRNKATPFNPNVKLDRGWEGGWVANCNTAGTFRSVEIRHDFTEEPYMGEPVFKIMGCDFSSRDHNIVVEGQDMVHATNNSFLVFENNADPNAGVRACVHFDGVSQGLIQGNISHGPGAYDSDTKATAFAQIVGPSCDILIKDNQIGNGGLGVVVNTTAGFNPRAGGRSIHVGPNYYGAKTLGWPIFKYLVDPGHKVILTEAPDPDLPYDAAALVSRTTDTNPSPRRAIRREREDFATNTAGVLGFYAQQGLNSAGAVKDVALDQADWENNTAGQESSLRRLWALSQGVLANFLTYSGVLDAVAIVARRLGVTTEVTNGDALPAFDITRRRTDAATSGATDVPQGQIRWRALNSALTEYDAATDVVRTRQNAAGAETTVREMYTRVGGVPTLKVRLDPDGVYVADLKQGVFTAGPVTPNGFIQMKTAAGEIVTVPVLKA